MLTDYDMQRMRADFPQLTIDDLNKMKRDAQELIEDWRQR